MLVVLPSGSVRCRLREVRPTLRPRAEAIVLKLVTENDTARGWWGSIRFTDAAGRPIQGIDGTLDPEAKN